MIEASSFMIKFLTFCETARFSKRLAKRLADDDYAKLQRYLAENPSAGALIEGGGGIRKIRFALPGRGKKWERQGNLLLVGGARINSASGYLCQERASRPDHRADEAPAP